MTGPKIIFTKIVLIAFTLFSLGILPVAGQKIEVETRINKETFPVAALEHVNQNYPERKRTKFYREMSGDSLSFEAKFCVNRHRYSVEFYADGSLMDVEKKIKFRTLPEETRQRVEDRWSQDFRKFRVVKCQEQTIGQQVRYEIEVRGKTQKETAYFQYLFTADGAFLNRQIILQRSSDMTLY